MRKMGDMRKTTKQANLPGRGRGDTQRDRRQSAPFQAAIDFFRLDPRPPQCDAPQPAADGAEPSPSKSNT